MSGCGWRCGAAVGFVLPLFRGSLLGFPPLFPNGIAMAFELAVYGGVAGALYARSRWKCLLALYRRVMRFMSGKCLRTSNAGCGAWRSGNRI